MAITLAFSCSEGLLLAPDTKNEVLGRLTEAVAHTLGRTFDEEQRLRKQVKPLYDIRSKFIHTGRAKEQARAREDALSLMYQVIRTKAEQLPEQGDG